MVTEVVRRVYVVPGTRIAHAFLIDADGLSLIDTGLPGSTPAVLRAIARLGRQLADLKHIIITHQHSDHFGCLADLADPSGANVSVHAADAPYVRGDRPLIPLKREGVLGWLAPIINRLQAQPRPHGVDRELEDGDELPIGDGLRVIHTPGHTPGHIALLLPAQRVLFAGDAVLNVLGLRPPLAWSTDDMRQAKESIRKLAELDFDIACFGHGGVLKGQANRRFRRLAERLAQ